MNPCSCFSPSGTSLRLEVTTASTTLFDVSMPCCRVMTFVFEVVRGWAAVPQQFSAAPRDLRGHSRAYTPARLLPVQSAHRIS